MKTCKKHKENPVIIYEKCIGCEIERLRDDILKLKEAMSAHILLNEIKNDKDAYLLSLGRWPMGIENHKPSKAEYGL